MKFFKICIQVTIFIIVRVYLLIWFRSCVINYQISGIAISLSFGFVEAAGSLKSIGNTNFKIRSTELHLNLFPWPAWYLRRRYIYLKIFSPKKPKHYSVSVAIVNVRTGLMPLNFSVCSVADYDWSRNAIYSVYLKFTHNVWKNQGNS